jgi:S1-C subfamily serine protease
VAFTGDGLEKVLDKSWWYKVVHFCTLDPIIDWQKKILDNGRSVALVIRRDQMAPVTDSVYKIVTEITLKQKFNLCPGQAFGEQPVAGEGTAFVVGEYNVMTAGHVLSAQVDQYAIIFGFEMRNKAGDYETLIPTSQIYYPKKVISRNQELDIMVLQLDRPLDRPALKFSNKTVLTPQIEIYMIGHPSGLPQKIALNASITAETEAYHFFTTLDAFQGNSGSPVFDFLTNEVIGILVSGETDYVWTGSCNTSSICKLPYCQGEKAVKIKEALEAE